MNIYTDKLCFREVIDEIKEGQTYTDGLTNIFMKNDQITIKDSKNRANKSFTYSENYCEFKLQRETYSFDKTFNAYEEGEEIESIVTGRKYRNKDNVHYCRDKKDEEYGRDWRISGGINIIEIRGRWYINK